MWEVLHLRNKSKFLRRMLREARVLTIPCTHKMRVSQPLVSCLCCAHVTRGSVAEFNPFALKPRAA